MTPLLSCNGVVGGHGGEAFVRGVDLHLHDGEILAILGPNGAGKSTLLMSIAGMLPLIGGSVDYLGEPVQARHPHRLTRRGLILVPDDRALFSRMTVRENLLVARRRSGGELSSILEHFPALTPRLDVQAGALSGGEQQMLALGRALIQEPRLLLIDEMSMGLAPSVVEDLLPILTQVASSGTAILMVEQHVALALEAASSVIVLVHGEVVLAGTSSELAADTRALEQAYIGNAGAARA